MPRHIIRKIQRSLSFNIIISAKKILNIFSVLILFTFQNGFSQNFWQQANGPFGGGGRIYSLAVSGPNLFAGTEGGVFLSTDNGTSWTVANSGLPNTRTNVLTVNGSNLFAGTNSGVFLSTDNGTGWTAVNAGLSNTTVSALGFKGIYLYAGTQGGGVFISNNNGFTWMAFNSGLTNLYIYAFAFNGANLFAATDDGVFLSTNNGANWTAMNTGLTNPYVKSFVLDGANLYAGTSGGGIFLSTNNGTNWTTVNTGLTNTDVKALAVIGTNLFAGTNGGGVFLSTNTGTSWTPVSKNKGVPWNIYSLAVSGTNLFTGTEIGAYLSTDTGTSWTVVNTGLGYAFVYSFAEKGTDLFAGTSYGGVFRTWDNGASWILAGSSFSGNIVRALTVVGTYLFAGTDGNGVSRSTNNGSSWAQVNSGLSNTNILTFAVIGTDLFAGTNGGGIFLSTDQGTNWTVVNSGLTFLTIYSLAVNGTDIFAGTNGGGIFLSTNNGTSWAPVNSGIPSNSIYTLAVSGANLLAGTNGSGVYLSTNNGTSWSPVNSGLGNVTVNTLAVSGANLLAGTNGSGVYLSTNNGTSWTPVNSGLTNNTVKTLAVVGTNLFAGTIGAGISGVFSGQMILPQSPSNFTAIPISDSQINLTWTASPWSDKYYIYRSLTSGTGFGKIDSVNSPGTSYNNSGLNPNTAYYYMIEAKNLWGISAASNEVNATTSPDATKPTVGVPNVIPATPELNTDVSISVSVTDAGSGVFGVTLFYKISGTSQFNSVSMIGSGNYYATIPAVVVTEKGVDYYFRAQDMIGNINTTRVYSIPVHVLQGASNKDPNTGQPVYQISGNTVDSYDIFSIPLYLDSPSALEFLNANPELGSYDQNRWRWYDFDRDTKQFVEYSGFSVLSPDRGFLLIVNVPNFQIKAGSGSTVPTNQPYSVQLTQGWNLVGNPFNYHIPFDSLAVTTGLFELWSCTNGGWTQNTSGMEAWHGYAVFVTQSTNFIIKPGISRLNKPVALFDVSRGDPTNWLIQIKTKLNDSRDVFNYVGQRENATNRYDPMDLHKPPSYGGDVRLEISHPDWSGQSGEIFATDVRQINPEGQFFDFDVVTTTQDGVGTLAFDGIQNLPTNYLAYLVDKTGNSSVNLRHRYQIEFAPVPSGKKQYRLLVGTKEFVIQNSNGVELFPTQFKLTQNYPNPFNPETNIQYSVPEPAHVRLEIFNLLGQKVRTLVDEIQPMDNYSVVWNSRNDNRILMPSGIYFYRISAGKFVQTRKMVLLK